jgi:hypothetical protein
MRLSAAMLFLLATMARASLGAQARGIQVLAELPVTGGSCGTSPTSVEFMRRGGEKTVDLDFDADHRSLSVVVDSTLKPVAFTDVVRHAGSRANAFERIYALFEPGGAVESGWHSRNDQSSSRATGSRQGQLADMDSARIRRLSYAVLRRCPP